MQPCAAGAMSRERNMVAALPDRAAIRHVGMAQAVLFSSSNFRRRAAIGQLPNDFRKLMIFRRPVLTANLRFAAPSLHALSAFSA